MKPAYVALLVLLATASLVLFAVSTLPLKPVVALVEPSGSSGKTKSTHRETKSTQRKTTNSGGVFSGSDPSDPRVYH